MRITSWNRRTGASWYVRLADSDGHDHMSALVRDELALPEAEGMARIGVLADPQLVEVNEVLAHVTPRVHAALVAAFFLLSNERSPDRQKRADDVVNVSSPVTKSAFIRETGKMDLCPIPRSGCRFGHRSIVVLMKPLLA